MALICRERKLLFIMVPGTGCSSIGKFLKEQFGGEFIPQERLCKDGKRMVDPKHNSIRELVKYGYLSRVELQLYLKFATIRNPFDRLATTYQRLIGGWTDNWLKREEAKLDYNISKDEKIYIQQLTKTKRQTIEWAKRIGFEKWLEYQLGLHKKNKFDVATRIKEKVKSLIIPYYFPRVYPLISGVDEVIRYEHLEEDFNTLIKNAGIIGRHDWVSIPNTNPTPGKKTYQEYFTPEARALVEKYWGKELAVFGYSFDPR